MNHHSVASRQSRGSRVDRSAGGDGAVGDARGLGRMNHHSVASRQSQGSRFQNGDALRKLLAGESVAVQLFDNLSLQDLYTDHGML